MIQRSNIETKDCSVTTVLTHSWRPPCSIHGLFVFLPDMKGNLLHWSMMVPDHRCLWVCYYCGERWCRTNLAAMKSSAFWVKHQHNCSRWSTSNKWQNSSRTGQKYFSSESHSFFRTSEWSLNYDNDAKFFQSWEKIWGFADEDFTHPPVLPKWEFSSLQQKVMVTRLLTPHNPRQHCRARMDNIL